MKTLANIFMTRYTGEWYSNVLKSIFGDAVSIRLYCQEDDSVFHIEPSDLYLLNVDILPPEVYQGIPENRIVYPRMTFRRDSVDQLRRLSSGTSLLMVHRNPDMAMESIANILRLGLQGLDFYPYSPGAAVPPACHIAATAGLPEMVPDGIDVVIDLGPRLLQTATIAEIALKLDLPDVLETQAYRDYAASLAVGSYSLENLSSKASGMESKLTSLLEALRLGIMGVDRDDVIFAYNTAAERMLGVPKSEILNCAVPQTAALLPRAFFLSTESSRASGRDAHIVRFRQTDFSVSSAPIVRKGEIMGYFTMLQPFAEEEQTQHKLRLQMLKKGYTTKYCFDDIVAECPEMIRTKTIAEKMASTDASILLMGESGTGKELFAHSIHHSSPRKDMPFVAINCAALTEELLESELFGYAEGAFTGAKKGGKLGLFEYAHQGTLFLDEIEGMSPNLQIKLLRVLQEKEIMRVGGSDIIPVDVRIVAASNEDIPNMVERGLFRKDLYYRLNTMPVEIPPLRRRGRDILLLLEQFKWQMGAEFELSPEAERLLLHHRWEGNVRELRNLAEYLKYMGSRIILVEDLPRPFLASGSRAPVLAEFFGICGRKREKGIFLMRTLGRLAEKGLFPGRRQIAAIAATEDISFSEQEVRGLTAALMEAGFLRPTENKRGHLLTEKGRALLSELPSSGYNRAISG